ncbi:MAG: hypothetical protein E6Q88_11820 [Lysobacteraceae bacterium]|nr:MAG: hypothetical protein E6Q88_11820 [Xanthomonadaceae bacterium]
MGSFFLPGVDLATPIGVDLPRGETSGDLDRIVLIETTEDIDPAFVDRALLDRGRSYRPIMHVNFVISPAAKRINFFQIPDTGRRKLLVPHQFSGIVTTPADHPGGNGAPAWSWVFEAFFRFVSFPVHLLELSLQAFCAAVLGNGSPSTIRSSWVSKPELDAKRRELNPDQHPCTPSDVLPSTGARYLRSPHPEEAGLGLIGYRGDTRSSSVQYVDSADRVVSEVVNAPFDGARSRGWRLEPDIRTIALHWISADHKANDGLLIGSFFIFEASD